MILLKLPMNLMLLILPYGPNKGEYVCIEPWWGISNYVNESNYLEERKSINKLKENEETSFSYKYTFTKVD